MPTVRAPRRCTGSLDITTPGLRELRLRALRAFGDAPVVLAVGPGRRAGAVVRATAWLAEECCGGNVLWALNERHLDYLERFVGSRSRDRDFPSPPGNRGLAYKLPKWMQLAHNRDELLRTISHMRRRVA